jgi:acetyl-CoA acetyltransferase
MEYGFMGPNYSISTACATSNYAFVSAANHIRNGDADMMLAGGSEAPIIPVGQGRQATRSEAPTIPMGHAGGELHGGRVDRPHPPCLVGFVGP